MSLAIKDMPFTIIPVETPLRLKYAQALSREQAFAKAANPPPLELGGILEDKAAFSRDLRLMGFHEQIRDFTYIKLPHTPVIIHQCMQQFIEPICMALRIHYGDAMIDTAGEFIALIIAQKTLKPGAYSTFGGLHMDCSFPNLFGMEANTSDQFIVSDMMPTMITQGGFDLRPVLSFVESESTWEERTSGIRESIVCEAFERVRGQTKESPIVIPAPYQMARYSDFTLHEAQMAQNICRRTVIGLQFFSACSARAYQFYMSPDEISNGRMMDYLRDPFATLHAPNARILDLVS